MTHAQTQTRTTKRKREIIDAGPCETTTTMTCAIGAELNFVKASSDTTILEPTVLFDIKGVNARNVHQLKDLGFGKGQSGCVAICSNLPFNCHDFMNNYYALNYQADSDHWKFECHEHELVVCRIHREIPATWHMDLETLQMHVRDLVNAVIHIDDLVTVVSQYAAYGHIEVTIHPSVLAFGKSSLPVLVYNVGNLTGYELLGPALPGMPHLPHMTLVSPSPCGERTMM